MNNTAMRIASLRKALSGLQLDMVLIGNLSNIRYLTGFTGSAGYLVVGHDDTTLYVDGRYSEQADQQFARGNVKMMPRDILTGVLRALRGARSGTRLGFESKHLPHEQWQRLVESPYGAQVVPTGDVVERLRSRKDSDEVAACVGIRAQGGAIVAPYVHNDRFSGQVGEP